MDRGVTTSETASAGLGGVVSSIAWQRPSFSFDRGPGLVWIERSTEGQARAEQRAPAGKPLSEAPRTHSARRAPPDAVDCLDPEGAYRPGWRATGRPTPADIPLEGAHRKDQTKKVFSYSMNG